MTRDERGERLHKVLARAGIGSKRTCERHIAEGRVSVDRRVVQAMGVRVDPERQEIRFDGERVHIPPRLAYLVYKPRGVVCTTADQFGRTAVVDLVHPPGGTRLFPVGRLEEDSEGLIIVTNDGSLAHELADYRRPVRQTYFLKLRGRVEPEALDKVREGVWLSEGRTAPMDIKVLRRTRKTTTLLATPAAYQHRMLRRAFARVGFHADKVVRVRIGPLTTHGLKKGAARRLRAEEISGMLAARRSTPGGGTGRGRRKGQEGQGRRRKGSRGRAAGGGGRRVIGP